MKYKIIPRGFPSTDGKHELKGRLFVPEKIKGIYHLVHGMIEHSGRYDELFGNLAEAGWLVVAYDNLGHGKTAAVNSDFGFISKNNGWKYLIKDVYSVGTTIKNEYKELPYILHGHSMGSFIVRCVAMYYPRLADKLVIMGTGGPNPAFGPALQLTDIAKIARGPRTQSPFLEKLALGKFNERFEKDEGDWFSKDPEVKRAFDADELCRFCFSTSAMHDLIKLNSVSNSKRFYNRINKDMPILIVSGEDDPVGDYGKGVKKVYNRLIKSGANAKLILYKNNRHEIHHDTAKERLLRDLLKFAED